MTQRRPVAVIAALLACVAGSVQAMDFRSVATGNTIFYDAPSTKARKLWVATRYYPVEVVVALDQWIKVRDVAGDLAWVERQALTSQRTLLVTAALAQVRREPRADAALVFQAEKGVALELLELAGGWARVKHPDGATGYVDVKQVWGL